jgi:ribose transport system permease protein
VRGLPIWLSLLIAMFAGFLSGIVSGFIIAKRKINDFIVTLGMLSVASGIALVLTVTGRPKQIISKPLATLAIGEVGQVPYLMFIALAIVAVAHFVLFHTRFGTHVFAVGGDPEAARAMGISITRIKIAVYAISGTLAGFAAMLCNI